MPNFESYMKDKWKDKWKEQSSSFNNMTDAEIDRESECMLRNLEEAEEWLEAVESWKQAGKPRKIKIA